MLDSAPGGGGEPVDPGGARLQRLGIVYFGVAGALKLEQSDAVFRRVRKLIRR
jgi:hypothetical protein